MASGSFSVSTSNQYISGSVAWSSSASTSTNSSSVSATMRLSRTNTGYTSYGSGSFYVTINGVKHTSATGTYTFTYNSNTLCASGTTTVVHNSDGNKSISIGWGGGISVFSVNASSGTANLGNAAPSVGTPASISYPNIDKTDSRTITVSWGAASGAEGYSITIFQDGAWTGGTGIAVGNVTSKSITLSSTTTSYAIGVRAHNDTGNGIFYGDWKTGSTFSIEAVTIPSPTSVSLSDTTPTRGSSYTLSWVAGQTTATTFYVDEQVDAGAWVSLGTVTGTSKSVTAKGSSVRYRVIPVAPNANYTNTGTHTYTATMTVGNPTMSSPTGVSLASSPVYSVGNTLSWNAVSGTGVNYDVEVSTDSGTTWTRISTGQTGTSISVTPNTSNVYYRVQANASTYNDSAWAYSSNYTVSDKQLSQPTGLTISDSTPIRGVTVTLSWNAVSSASSYAVTVTDAVSSITLNVSSNSVTYTPTVAGGLGFTVRAVGSGYYSDSSIASSSSYSVSNPTLGTVTGVTVTPADPYYNQNVTVSWTAVTSATSYKIEKSLDNGVTYPYSYTSTNPTYTTPANGSQIRFRITAVASNYNDSTPVVSTNFTVTNATLLAPDTISYPSVITKGQTVTITWGGVSNNSGYQLQVKEGTSGVWTAVTVASGATSATYTCNTKGSIQFQVRAIGSGFYSTGPYKVGAVVEVDYPKLANPTGLTLSTTAPVYKTNMTVSWTAVANATSYVVEKSYDGGVTYPNVYPTTALNYTTDASGAQVRLRVKALATGYYDSDYTTSANLTVVNAKLPSPATITYATSITRGNSVAIAWDAVANSSGYTVEVSENAGTWRSISTTAIAGTSANYIVNIDGTVQFRVMANGAGQYDSSTYTTGTKVTIGFPALSIPATITYNAGTVRGANVTVSWSAVANATGYVLEYSKDSGTFASAYTGSATSTAVPVDGDSYSFRVKATASNYSESGYRTGAVQSTSYPVLSAPASISISEPTGGFQGGDTVNIGWGAVTNATSYTIEGSYDAFATSFSVYTGTQLIAAYTIPKDRTKTSLKFRVKASATKYNDSPFIESSALTIKQNTTPTLVITNPTVSKVIKDDGTFTISGTLTDPDAQTITLTATVASVVKTTTIAGPVTAKAWSIDFTGAVLPEGTHTASFSVVADDAEGGSVTQYYTGDLTVDKSTPQITVGGVAAGTTYTDVATPTFSATDSVSGVKTTTATLDGVAFTSGTAVTSAGSHTLVVTSTDNAGNTTSVSRTFFINKTPVFTSVSLEGNDELAGYNPLTNGGSYPFSNTAKADLVFKVKSHDDNADALQYQVRLRGTLYKDWASLTPDIDVLIQLPFSSLTLGDNLVEIVVKDTKNVSASFSLTLRNRVPSSLSLATAEQVLETFKGGDYKSTCLNDLKYTGYTGNASLQDILNSLV